MTGRSRPGEEPPWIKSRRGGWESKASNLDLHQWLRVHALAMARMPGNRHVTFQPGELGQVLSVVDKKTGVLKPDKNIDRAVKDAIRFGYVHPASTTRCVRILKEDAAYPLFGQEDRPCPVCDRGT
ncbi:hypothetical protein [Aeromicrobium wangtongii]|uniref:hypothetical protein n=1 Tax=Aeromicrobium wangtongii TaxID=2969247 RepID=UPI002016B8F5|nr:hypothetical protein [Aeromicrobium wangtongii]MCL3818548.1 hypothetical protein [Aeromicrobium wangtongii]